MKRLSLLGYSLGRSTPALVALAGTLAAALSTRAAQAGCGDGACGRVDWTEVTDSRQGTPVAAKIHGAYAWESSPDGWVTHPIGGTLSGYLWLSCVPPGDSGPVEATCTDLLAIELAKKGTTTPITWSGVANYDPTTKMPTVPRGLYSESQSGATEYLIAFPLGGMPLNQAVCPTALAFGRDAGAPDAGTGTGADSGNSGPSSGGTSGTGSTHGSTTGGGPVGQGGTDAGGMNGGGTSSGGGGASSSGGSAGSKTTGTGSRPPGDTGGSTGSANAAAAEAGGGCTVSTRGAPPSHHSGFWVAALALGLVRIRRVQNVRRRSP